MQRRGATENREVSLERFSPPGDLKQKLRVNDREWFRAGKESDPLDETCVSKVTKQSWTRKTATMEATPTFVW